MSYVFQQLSVSTSNATLTPNFLSADQQLLAGTLVLPWDPYGSQSDTPNRYRYEGRSDANSRAGSPLSALNTSSSGDDADRDMNLGQLFGRLGRPFINLARLYQEEEGTADVNQCSSSSSSSIQSESSLTPKYLRWTGARQSRCGSSQLVPPESWV